MISWIVMSAIVVSMILKVVLCMTKPGECSVAIVVFDVEEFNPGYYFSLYCQSQNRQFNSTQSTSRYHQFWMISAGTKSSFSVDFNRGNTTSVVFCAQHENICAQYNRWYNSVEDSISSTASKSACQSSQQEQFFLED